MPGAPVVVNAELDHLVIVAPTLTAGGDSVARALGVEMLAGGEHPLMGTHNLLLRLGDATYLEVMAVNPAATAPAHPRWFGVDRLAADDEPRLTTWVARTSDIESACTSALTPIGDIERMKRGSFQWRMSLPPDGALVHGGLVPALIQWDSPVHPATGLPDSGCSLALLEAFTPDTELLRRQLVSLGLGSAVAISATRGVPRLVAHINTPAGKRRLCA